MDIHSPIDIAHVHMQTHQVRCWCHNHHLCLPLQVGYTALTDAIKRCGDCKEVVRAFIANGWSASEPQQVTPTAHTSSIHVTRKVILSIYMIIMVFSYVLGLVSKVPIQTH